MAPATQGPGADGPLLSVGTVRKPHGIRGELQVALDTDRPESVFRPGRTLQLGDRYGRSIGGTVTVRSSRPFRDGVLLQLEECPDRNAAEELRGATLLIPPEAAAPARADEVPYHVLVGSAVLVAGERLGTVREVLEAGGGQVLIVRRDAGGEAMIPFVREIVRSIDAERREVVIEPPEGLFEP